LATRGEKLVFLEKCLRDLENQTFKDFELILLVSHYSNRLQEICDTYNIIPLKDDSTSLGAARNLGVKKASGYLIVFTDDDCELPETWLERIFLTFQQWPSIVALGGPNLTPPSKQKGAFHMAIGSFEDSRRQGEAFDKSAVNKIGGCNSTYKKDIFEKIGFLNTQMRYGEDLDFNIRLAENGYKLRFDPKIFVWHHRRENLKDGLRHVLKSSEGSALLFLSWKTFTYSRYESFISSFYLSNFMAFVLIAALLLSPITFLFLFLIVIFGYTTFTVLRTNLRKAKVISYIPILITLTTICRLVGFYYGITRYLWARIRRKAL
jgi:GT2 family glycosyltransferase